MTVSVFNTQDDLKIDPASARRVVKKILELENIRTDYLELSFVSKEKICCLHDRFFQDSSPTDCISLPMDPLGDSCTPHVLGEIFVCPAVAIERVGKKEAYRETTLYVVHGLLHLIGFDDIEIDEQNEMEAKEEEYMQLLTREGILLEDKTLVKKKFASYSLIRSGMGTGTGTNNSSG